MIKFNISPYTINKWQETMELHLGYKIDKCNISIMPDGKQYRFEFVEPQLGGGKWHFELDMTPTINDTYQMWCSLRVINLIKRDVTDLVKFCNCIIKVKQMQTDYINSKYAPHKKTKR